MFPYTVEPLTRIANVLVYHIGFPTPVEKALRPNPYMTESVCWEVRAQHNIN